MGFYFFSHLYAHINDSILHKYQSHHQTLNVSILEHPTYTVMAGSSDPLLFISGTKIQLTEIGRT